MGFTKVMLLCSITLALLKLPSPSLGKATACIAGDFVAGQNASLVCDFSDDIDAHESVFVQYTPFSAQAGASATKVLLCKEHELEKSNCKPSDGYIFKSKTRNTLSVDIPNVAEKSAGIYVCQFLPHDGSPREPCNLTVREASIPVSLDNHHVTITSGKQQDSSTDVPTGEAGTISVGAIVGGVVGVLVAIIVSAAVIFYCHKRQCCLPRSRRGPKKRSIYQGKTSSGPKRRSTNEEVQLIKNEKDTSPGVSTEGKPCDQSAVSTDRTEGKPCDQSAVSADMTEGKPCDQSAVSTDRTEGKSSDQSAVSPDRTEGKPCDQSAVSPDRPCIHTSATFTTPDNSANIQATGQGSRLSLEINATCDHITSARHLHL